MPMSNNTGKFNCQQKKRITKSTAWHIALYAAETLTKASKTTLSKVIWEEGRIEVLSDMYAVKSSSVTMARSKFAPKSTLPTDRSPNPTTYLIPGPVRPMKPNGIRIRSAIFPQCTGQTNRQTDRPTDRQIVHGKV